MREITLPIALRGLATEFAESEQPPDFARALENRFINLYGSAERRPGVQEVPSPTPTSGGGMVAGQFEYVNSDGNGELLAALNILPLGSNSCYVYNSSAQSWTTLSSPSEASPHDAAIDARVDDSTVLSYVFSEQFNDKLIIYNEDTWPIYYDGTNQLKRLRPIISKGVESSGSNTTTLKDADVTNWLTDTNVNLNDLVYNASKGGYGIVTSVGANNIDHTAIGSAATGMGRALSNQTSGDIYEIYDLRELNIIPQSDIVDIKDNVAIAGAGTTPINVAVSGINFSRLGIIPGDYIYNTTRSSVTRVGDVSADVALAYKNALTEITSANSISGQSPGDSLVFLKSALPPFVKCHTHYGRLYGIDARERSKVRVSGPDDAQDFSTFEDTADAGSLNYGARQGQGEELLDISTFQKYLTVGGKKNVYLTEGTDPIADVSGDTVSFTPVGLFSQGCVSNLSLANIGSNMLFAANDGMRSFNILDVLQVQTDNISEVIKSELRTAIKSNLETPENIQVIHYPRRNWVMFKVGNTIYNYNYTPTYQQGQLVQNGSWSKFTGRLSECNTFLVKQNGDLVCSYYDSAENRSIFYEFDTGYYDDNGTIINTQYQTAWLTPSGDAIVSDGRYLRPFFENAAATVYNINAVSDLGTQLVDDTAVVSASGGPVIGSWVIGTDPIGGDAVTNEDKIPLRWRGKNVQLNITTSAGIGEEAISKFVLYTNTFGRE